MLCIKGLYVDRKKPPHLRGVSFLGGFQIKDSKNRGVSPGRFLFLQVLHMDTTQKRSLPRFFNFFLFSINIELYKWGMLYW